MWSAELVIINFLMLASKTQEEDQTIRPTFKRQKPTHCYISSPVWRLSDCRSTPVSAHSYQSHHYHLKQQIMMWLIWIDGERCLTHFDDQRESNHWKATNVKGFCPVDVTGRCLKVRGTCVSQTDKYSKHYCVFQQGIQPQLLQQGSLMAGVKVWIWSRLLLKKKNCDQRTSCGYIYIFFFSTESDFFLNFSVLLMQSSCKVISMFSHPLSEYIHTITFITPLALFIMVSCIKQFS